MRRVLIISVATAIAFASQIVVGGERPIATADENQAVLQADHTLSGAVEKGDQKAVGALLDERFQWTDVEGNSRNKAEVLENLTLLAASNEGDTEVKSRFYGQLALIYGFHHGARFSRIWVKHPDGWRAIVFLDTRVPKQAAASVVPGIVGDCENPCQTVPYTPTTATDQAILAEWQKTKMDEWHPNVDDWATHLADEFLIINSNSERTKAERVGIAIKQQEAGLGVPGDPVVSMSMSDFGDAVLMFSNHVPYHGGKPYYSVRVFVKRNGHWLLAWSQQTTIQTAAPVGAVTAKK